ncbi:pleiotropic regulator 1 [Homo sapiens]|uniref:Pleiotropic regulator 1 n=1 Tax=Homo sapiens TaxID=9606 RepID=D6RE04_HUMAN|nr:pleiotropic regulator 1 [Homo sapiens]KAI4027410.1 pleiotropic regulator 1 [Homo sapiens]
MVESTLIETNIIFHLDWCISSPLVGFLASILFYKLFCLKRGTETFCTHPCVQVVEEDP